MLDALKIVMLVGGLYTLIKGEIPRWLLKKTSPYEVKGSRARLMGLVMMLPIPCSFVTFSALVGNGMIQQGDGLLILGLDVFITALFGFATLGLFYLNRQPLSTDNEETQLQ